VQIAYQARAAAAQPPERLHGPIRDSAQPRTLTFAESEKAHVRLGSSGYFAVAA
jgi:hypothetical protein